MVAKHGRRAAPAAKRSTVRSSVAVLLAVGAVAGALLMRHHAGSSTIATTTTTALPTTTLPPTISLAAVGDTDLGATPTLPSSPAAEFAPVKGLLRGDIVFANLEGTMTNSSSGSKCGVASTSCYAFHVPTTFAQYYRAAGFTVLNSANNHSYDFAAQGVAATSAALRSVGIVQAGLPGQIGYVAVHGVRVAFVDVAPYYLTNNMLVPSQLPALITEAKHHASIVVVYMHTGAEGSSADHVTKANEYYYGENRGNPYAYAHAAIDDGADLVLGSGPHVWRGMEFYRGHLIVYSMGDFTNYHAFSSWGNLSLSGVVHVTLSSTGAFVRGSIDPVIIEQGGLAVPDSRHQLWGFINGLSHSDFGASAALVSATGQIER